MQTRQGVSKDFPSFKEPKDFQSVKESCNYGGDFVDKAAFSQGHDLSDPEQKHLFWERHLEQCCQSPLTQKAYCEEHGLKLQQFYYWKRRLVSDHDEVSFLPVDLLKNNPADRSSCVVRIIAPNGVAIELEGPVNLAEVLSMAAGL